jgi:hypothetical protein
LMHAIINFHPFVDGNKRVALLAANFYLHWNGYRLKIPKDADDFTIDVAKGNLGLNDILVWLYRNSTRTVGTVIMHWLCESEMQSYGKKPSKAPILKRLTDAQRMVLFPLEAIRFFRMKIIEERDKLSLKLHGNSKHT